jgi:hypothetical protein
MSPPAAHTPADKQVVAAQLVAGVQLVRAPGTRARRDDQTPRAGGALAADHRAGAATGGQFRGAHTLPTAARAQGAGADGSGNPARNGVRHAADPRLP